MNSWYKVLSPYINLRVNSVGECVKSCILMGF